MLNRILADKAYPSSKIFLRDAFASKRVESRVVTDNLSGPQLMESPYSPILPRRIGNLTKDTRLGNVHDNRKNVNRVHTWAQFTG
ncbi:MAG: hypothetical protein P4L38_02390 [Syntrophaceae bacterium]|nr:hypothetical protein [Syntrophaceae bacterium]